MTTARPTKNIAGMNRIELTRLVRRLTAERDAARYAARYWRRLTDNDWRLWSPQQTHDYAAAILAEIGMDPKWADHRDTLAFELDANRRPQPQALVHPPSVGLRCWRGSKPCGRPLRADGLCTRHDARAIRAARTAAAA